MLQPELIRGPRRLREISGDWQTLAGQLQGITPFQLPEWQLTWWSHFGSGELRAFAFWDERKLVGLMPLFLHEWNGRRQLTLLGSGLTDYLEPCVSSAEVYDSLSVQLQSDPDWDLCDWQDLSAGTPLRDLKGVQVSVEPDTPCSAIPLAASFDDYWRARSADLRRNIKRYARKAEAEGELRFTVFEQSDPVFIGGLILLHAERWQRRGEPGMVEVNHSADFLRDVTAFHSCRFFNLQWKGQTVAATAGFLKDRTLYSYLSAFDPKYEILGFGRYLLYRSLLWAFDGGCDKWDFLRGDESYKASWGAVQTPKCRVRITRS